MDNDFFSDSESDTSDVIPSSGWRIEKEEEWAVAVNELTFRHPRVLLAYFRFLTLHNEIAPPQERILIPNMPKKVSDFILKHPSIQDTPPEFKSEVDALRAYISLFSGN